MSDDQQRSEDRRFCPSCGIEGLPGSSQCAQCWRPLPIGSGVPKASSVGQSASADTADAAPVYRGPPPASVTPSQIVVPSVTIESGSSVKKKGGKKKTFMAIVLLIIVIALCGVIAAITSHHPQVSPQSVGSAAPGTPNTPEQQFAADAVAQIQTVHDAMNSRTLNDAALAAYGDNICNLLPQYLNSYGPGPSAFNQIANEYSEGLTSFRITGPDDGRFVSLAIRDICPSYTGDIPYGATG